ncbi:MAG TPA: sigma-70 family RNA polymerase sigma factor [Rudaea sp.]|nr:sigma-70 family RNA polymerase sigma factor [Rudaea sp.]
MTQLESLVESRRQFLALVADLRPELHRYCARMTGSIADGEDVVQETLARAYYALPEFPDTPELRPWLFRIAHNRALDFLRRYEHRMGQSMDAAPDIAGDDAEDPEDALAREHAMHAAVSRFVELAPAQRSCVILKDVLGHSLDEIAALLELSVAAVKAALHRGRVRLRDELANVAEIAARPASPVVARYAALFNARDWDGVRAMLADDVRLDLVQRSQRAGRREVGVYFTNYDHVSDWRLRPAWLEDREVLAVYREPGDARPGYFIELTLVDDRVSVIRDFRYVSYVAHEAVFEFG